MRFLLMLIVSVLVGLATGSVLWAFLTFIALVVLWIAAVMLGMVLLAVGLSTIVKADAFNRHRF